MRLRFLAFSDRGMALARRLADALGGTAGRCGAGELQDWTKQAFSEAEGLVFVGAAGIAVRAIAPFVAGKQTDPAVVAVDECGRFAVPLLSGHLGGANDLARRISDICGAEAVITTATDRNGIFAVDAWARIQGCRIENPERIREISSRLLRGETAVLRSDFRIAGEVPAGIRLTDAADADICLSIRRESSALCVVPVIAVLGIGCKKGMPQAAIEDCFSDLLRQSRISAAAFSDAASIDRKAQEPGLLDFCAAHGLPLRTFSAEALQAVPGKFSASDFVKAVTGTDNVCERSAVKASGGTLAVQKFTGNGVTMAVALRPFSPDWRWQDGETLCGGHRPG